VALIVGNLQDGVPMHVVARCGGARGILRFAGSTASNTSAEEQEHLRVFMRLTFQDLDLRDVVLMSGGTRVLDDDYRTVMTILELPSLIRSWNPTCRTLGSMPRTTPTMSLVGDSRFVPSDQVDAKTLIHPGLDVAWIVQLNASETTADWGLDLPGYFDLMDDLRGDTGDEQMATGLIVWGGGAVTAREIMEAVTRGHPVAVIAGSGRFADSFGAWKYNLPDEVDPAFLPTLEAWRDAGFDFEAPHLIGRPRELQSWLRSHRFLP
jgi:hypothetical protein